MKLIRGPRWTTAQTGAMATMVRRRSRVGVLNAVVLDKATVGLGGCLR
jgi:hypothetical protein